MIPEIRKGTIAPSKTPVKIRGYVIEMKSYELIWCRLQLKRNPPKRAMPASAAGCMAKALLRADAL
jgi:hypothetical protein